MEKSNTSRVNIPALERHKNAIVEAVSFAAKREMRWKLDTRERCVNFEHLSYPTYDGGCVIAMCSYSRERELSPRPLGTETVRG